MVEGNDCKKIKVGFVYQHVEIVWQTYLNKILPALSSPPPLIISLLQATFGVLGIWYVVYFIRFFFNGCLLYS